MSVRFTRARETSFCLNKRLTTPTFAGPRNVSEMYKTEYIYTKYNNHYHFRVQTVITTFQQILEELELGQYRSLKSSGLNKAGRIPL